mmetsp:Transcript_12931/g.15676  ORF Transcript_12931/g.15676 Transcript_12931/m.15676 type:complete len:617 (+) Transcript_12931:249-2099(+)|eukprot:CAMPEP_0184018946 /NCGR_PEP_ID=MMETSP0954-20121128/8459_1 /TAXON_ID=627963 /ORGANISM="Aplanochytrium sp, Strain PBS07" /LENGTH=616 /DNA_ID=CAMNT_0026300519 /DNA_START=291 /DNA_END=2141 /DNA_ORIENTATION=+
MLDFQVTVQPYLGKSRLGPYIVDNVSGRVHKGEMMVIMGASGSGKSTLLQCIARRGPVVRDINSFAVKADISWEGSRVKDKVFHKQCGFVQQDEMFFPMLTVRESLFVAARLRLPCKLKYHQIRERVDDYLIRLNLLDCASTQVGSDMKKGVSGGERKRLNIACEIIAKPSVMLLDEPTSGLDSATATKVVSMLQSLALNGNETSLAARNSGKTVVCVLHQPRWGLVQMFQKIMVLHRGQVLYLGSPEDIQPYFMGAGVEFPPGENIMDVVFDVVNGEQQDETTFLLLQEQNRIREEASSEFLLPHVSDASFVDPETGLLPVVTADPSGSLRVSAQSKIKRNPWFYTFRVLLRRYWVEKMKDPLVIQSQFMFAVMFGLIVGIVYFRLGRTPVEVQARMGCLAFSIMLQSFIAFDIIILFPKERAIYLKESGQSLYTPSAFFLARTFAEFPSHFLNAAVFATVTFFMVGLHNFLWYFILIQLSTHAGVSLLLAISALSKTLDIANVTASVVLVIFFLFDGFYIRISALPIALQWFSELSFIRVAVKGCWANELQDIEVNFGICDRIQEDCPFPDMEAVLAFYEVDDVHVPSVCVQLAIYIVAYRFIGFLALKYMHKS